MGEVVKKEVVEWIKVIVIVFVLVFVIICFIVLIIVKGELMYFILVECDYLIVNRIVYKVGELKYKDIIVFKIDLIEENGKKKDLVKRVIGVFGDYVKI